MLLLSAHTSWHSVSPILLPGKSCGITCPFDSSASSFKSAFDRKTERYVRLALDLEQLGFTVFNMPLEIGARGVITVRNHMVLATVASMYGIRNMLVLRRSLGKISLMASHRIYLARASSDWTSGDFVKPNPFSLTTNVIVKSSDPGDIQYKKEIFHLPGNQDLTIYSKYLWYIMYLYRRAAVERP